MGKSSTVWIGGNFQSQQKGKVGFSWGKKIFFLNPKNIQIKQKNWAFPGPGALLCWNFSPSISKLLFSEGFTCNVIFFYLSFFFLLKNSLSFSSFVLVSTAISIFPVLSRIFQDPNCVLPLPPIPSPTKSQKKIQNYPWKTESAQGTSAPSLECS